MQIESGTDENLKPNILFGKFTGKLRKIYNPKGVSSLGPSFPGTHVFLLLRVGERNSIKLKY